MNARTFTFLLITGLSLLNGWGVADVKTTSLVSVDLSAVRARPNPWRIDQHGSLPGITIDNLPQGSTVKIFTVSGHWLKTLSPAASSVVWDLTNNHGDKVASGIYLYLVTAGSQKTQGKIAVIK